MSTANPLKLLSPEEYLHRKNIRYLLERLILSLLDERPDQVEKHLITFLTTILPPEPSENEGSSSLQNNYFPQPKSSTFPQNQFTSFPQSAPTNFHQEYSDSSQNVVYFPERTKAAPFSQQTQPSSLSSFPEKAVQQTNQSPQLPSTHAAFPQPTAHSAFPEKPQPQAFPQQTNQSPQVPSTHAAFPEKPQPQTFPQHTNQSPQPTAHSAFPEKPDHQAFPQHTNQSPQAPPTHAAFPEKSPHQQPVGQPHPETSGHVQAASSTSEKTTNEPPQKPELVPFPDHSPVHEDSSTSQARQPQSQSALIQQFPDVKLRRKSAINPAILARAAKDPRRRAILPTISTNTQVEIKYVPKDPATFENLMRIFKNIELFSFLNEEQRNTIVGAMILKTYQPEEVIIKQGDQPDFFYIFESGQCRVLKNIDGQEKFLAIIPPGGYAGELGLISGSPRAATIIADTAVTAWATDKKTYWVLLREGHQKKRETYTEILSNMELMKILDKYHICLIVDALHPLEVQAGEVIIKQGDIGESFYILIDGECGISKPLTGTGEEIAVIRSGGYFGERALLLNEPRAATVVAKTPCKLVRLESKTFTRLLKPVIPALLERIKSFNN